MTRRGMTLVELLVALVIMTIVSTLGVLAVGQLTSADLDSGAGELSANIHYAFNLASVNNQMYAIYLDLDKGTYHVGEIPQENECDRLLLNVNSKGDDSIVRRYGDPDKEDSDSDEDPGMFAGLGGSSGLNSDRSVPNLALSTANRNKSFMNMLSNEVQEAATDEARAAGVEVDNTPRGTERDHKRNRVNRAEKAIRLPPGVRISGVLLREGDDPIESGVVPILVYPHGYLQRALIYLEAGREESPEEVTLELMSLQGRVEIHPGALDNSHFAREIP